MGNIQKWNILLTGLRREEIEIGTDEGDTSVCE